MEPLDLEAETLELVWDQAQPMGLFATPVQVAGLAESRNLAGQCCVRPVFFGACENRPALALRVALMGS